MINAGGNLAAIPDERLAFFQISLADFGIAVRVAPPGDPNPHIRMFPEQVADPEFRIDVEWRNRGPEGEICAEEIRLVVVIEGITGDGTLPFQRLVVTDLDQMPRLRVNLGMGVENAQKKSPNRWRVDPTLVYHGAIVGIAGFFARGGRSPKLLDSTGLSGIVSAMEGITPETIRGMKGRAQIAALTAYDFPMTRLLDEAGIPLLLVGDSVGMVVLGYPDTTLVKIEEIEHHVRAAARAKPRALLAADLPYQTYETPEEAVANAQRLVAAGARAVKAEGGRAILPQVKTITGAGIPFIGHLGMLPQHVREEGGYSVKGKAEEERNALIEDAQALESAGAFAIVLELVAPSTAASISQAISIPTIGIGSGIGCDGQILVTSDLLGLFPWFTPRFVKPRLNAAEQMRTVIREWKQQVENPAELIK
jgi:3-methyl-2-oxobutanoate hydroxymethyltransferase